MPKIEDSGMTEALQGILNISVIINHIVEYYMKCVV